MKPEDTKLNFIPMDYYCPSLQNQLNRRICKKCNLYFASIKNVTNHNKLMHNKKNADKSLIACEESEKSDNDTTIPISSDNFLTASEEKQTTLLGDGNNLSDKETEQNESNNDSIPIIQNIENWITNPWTED